MSTAAGAPIAPSPAKAGSASDQLISERIAEACKALWWAELTRRLLLLVIVAIVAILIWAVVDHWIYSPNTIIRLIACVALAGGAIWYVVRRIIPVLAQSVRPEYAARSLERDLPDMKQDLTSYVTLRPQATTKDLRDRVVRTIGSVTAGRLRNHDALPTEATGTMRWWMAALAALALLAGYTVLSTKSTIASTIRLVAPLAAIEPAKRVSIEDVQPGDVEAIAGRSLTVSAKIQGLGDDESVLCRWESASRENEFQLQFNEETSRYQGDLELDHSAAGQIPYTIYAGDDSAGPHWLSVKNLPVVAVESIQYEPPAYTAEIPHTSSSASISAVDGTQVTVHAKTNRPIQKANIEFNPRMLGEVIRATAGNRSMTIDDDGMTLSITFPLRNASERSSAVQFESYRIRVWDEADQTNPEPIIYPIRVIPDLAPEVAIVLPRKSPKSMGVELQQIVEVHAMDPDFGLKQVDLEIRRGIDVIKRPTLWSSETGEKGNQVAEYRFRPSEHGLRVGDVVQITAIATDNRFVADDSKIEPNISVTDPVELRIIGEQRASDPQAADDGLTETDQRPSSDHEKDNMGGEKSASKDGDQKQGGGTGGKGESSQQQKGEGGEGSGSGGEDQTGEGESPDKENQPNKNQGGKGDSKGEPQDGSPDGGQSDASGQPNADNGGEPQTGNSADQTQDGSKAKQEGQPNKNQPNKNQENEGQPKEGQPNENQPNTNQDQKDQTNSGQQNGTQPNKGQPSQSQGDNANQTPSADPNGATASGENSDSSDGAPKHPGEAFEKIRDYLDKKKKEEAQQQNKGEGEKGVGEKPEGQEGAGEKTAGENGPGEKPESQKGAGEKAAGENGPGEKPEGQKGAGEKAAGENGPGEKPESQKGAGKKAAGENGPGEKPESQKGAGKKAAGENGPGEKPESQKGAGEKTAGENGPGEKPEGQKGAGEKTAGENGPGEKPEGQKGAGEKAAGENGAGEKPESQKGAGEKAAGENGPGEKPEGQKGAGEKAAGENGAGEKPESQKGAGEKGGKSAGEKGEGEAGEGQGKGNVGQSGDSSSSAKGSDKPGSSDSQGSAGATSGDGANGSGEGGEGAPPPAAADMEYTKKATDMVLDYLEETRDAPDQELLKELDWTEEDMKNFADRWQKTRQMEQPGVDPSKKNKEIQEALESLGLRPPAPSDSQNIRGTADDLRSIRDSGNRKPAPAAYRDIFDAFRRGINQKK